MTVRSTRVDARSDITRSDITRSARPRDLPGLTSLRAVAALLVFAYHAHEGVPLGPIGAGGYCGVAFFYVLSGFVLTWGTDPSHQAKAFYLRRFARIYPSHLAIWLLVLALPVVSGPHGIHAVVNLFLLQAWSWRLPDVFSMNGVTWSLSCEMFFYALFPLLFAASLRWRLRTQWLAAIGLFAAATVVVVTGSYADPNGAYALIAGANPLVRLPEFVLGVVGARTLLSGRRLPPWSFVVVAVFTLSGLVHWHGSPTGSTWLAPVFLLVIVAVADRAVRGRLVFSRRWMVYAGKVSFAFYLVHQLVLKEMFARFGDGWAPAGAALLLSGGLAVALHHGVEMPAHRWIVSRFGVRRRTTPSDAVAE